MCSHSRSNESQVCKCHVMLCFRKMLGQTVKQVKLQILEILLGWKSLILTLEFIILFCFII